MARYQQVAHAIILAMLLVPSGSCRDSEPLQSSREETPKPEIVVLSGDSLDALDLVIAMNSLNSSLNPIELSPKLQERLSKYDNKVQFEVNIKGVTEPLVADGAKTIIPAGAQFGVKLQGALNAEIHILKGEVGVINGEIFVSEGTQVSIDGRRYEYKQGQWVQTAAATAGESSKQEQRVRAWKKTPNPAAPADRKASLSGR